MIKRKNDIQDFLFSFCLYAQWDGKKFYITVPDDPSGTITLMQYSEGQFTKHRINECFCDRIETPIEEAELSNIIWNKRKYINRIIDSAR